VPLADHRGLVAGLLQLFRDVVARGVQTIVERVDAVFVAVLARRGVKMEFVQKQLVSRTPPAAMRSRFGV